MVEKGKGWHNESGYHSMARLTGASGKPKYVKTYQVLYKVTPQSFFSRSKEFKSKKQAELLAKKISYPEKEVIDIEREKPEKLSYNAELFKLSQGKPTTISEDTVYEMFEVEKKRKSTNANGFEEYLGMLEDNGWKITK